MERSYLPRGGPIEKIDPGQRKGIGNNIIPPRGSYRVEKFIQEERREGDDLWGQSGVTSVQDLPGGTVSFVGIPATGIEPEVVGGGLIVSDEVTGLSADVRVRMLLVHQDQGFRDRGVSISFGYDPTPSTPLGFMAKLTPSWGGQATSGARALWGRETMAGMAQGGMASGNRLESELGYGLPVGSRLVGTPRFGIGTSEHGRDYRLGYGLTVLQRGSMSFELGIAGTRRESSMQGVTDHGALARLTARW